MQLVDNAFLIKSLVERTPLSERELDVIEMRFCHDMTYKDIGAELGVTGNRIHQMVAKILRKLRRSDI
jgi:RNA polymerase sigma factor (sigma-70 family)